MENSSIYRNVRERLGAALDFRYDKAAVFAREREANRIKNAKIKPEKTQEYRRRRLARPGIKEADSAQAKVRWLMQHAEFHTPTYRTALTIKAVEDLLGCKAAQFKKWIEEQFWDGMTWENRGTKWQLGHRIPRRLFDCSDPQQLRACFYYTNLQPELPEENSRRLNERS